MNFRAFLIISIAINFSSQANSQENTNKVSIIGAMKDVMWKGQLGGKITLDTIIKKTNLYGLGPVDYLSGEILIIEGKSYKSTVGPDSKMKVEETYQISAPFFGYANIQSWEEHPLPQNVKSITDLEKHLDKITKSAARPFMFKLTGTIAKAKIHVVNLPKGSKVSSPEEAHQGQENYLIENRNVDIVGFFSTEHKTIFTHHDKFLHMHLITDDREQMGHLDELILNPNEVKLFLPK